MQSTAASQTLHLAVHGPQRLAQLHSLGEVLQLADGDGVRRSCADDMQSGWRQASGRWPLHCRWTPASFAAAALLPAPLLKGGLKHGELSKPVWRKEVQTELRPCELSGVGWFRKAWLSR